MVATVLPFCCKLYLEVIRNEWTQAEEPWNGRYNGSDVREMEMLIMRAIGWSPIALTSAGFLDNLLCDALSGVLYHLQFQSQDFLASVRQFAAQLLSHTLSGVIF